MTLLLGAILAAGLLLCAAPWVWPRGGEQTAQEYAARVGQSHAPLADAARDLGQLYTRTAYSSRPLPPDTSERLANLWRVLEATPPRVTAAWRGVRGQRYRALSVGPAASRPAGRAISAGQPGECMLTCVPCASGRAFRRGSAGGPSSPR